MNKHFNIITINGIRGVIAAIFVVCGLIAGFVISPGWVCMKLWNLAIENSNTVAVMNLFQGIMLWAIIALSLYALNNKRALIGFGSYPSLSPSQINDIMERAKKTEEKIIKDMEELKSKETLNKENKEEKELEELRK